MRPPLLRTFSYHYNEKFGLPVGKVVLDPGETCPNREKGGCLFCSAPGFSPWYLLEKGEISEQVRRGKKHLLKNRAVHYLGYFQQENPTSTKQDRLLGMFAEVLADQDCLGLIVSTRPDSLSSNLLARLSDLLQETGKSCLFELGLQSMHEKSLRFMNRNHSYADFLKGYEKIKKFGCFETGVHLLFGIPGESLQDMITTVETVCKLKIDAVKLHHLQVLKNTPLQEMYENGEIKTFSRREYLDLLLQLLPLIPENIVIHRLWATAHPQLLVAPRWNVTATVLSAELRKTMSARGIRQGMACAASERNRQ